MATASTKSMKKLSGWLWRTEELKHTAITLSRQYTLIRRFSLPQSLSNFQTAADQNHPEALFNMVCVHGDGSGQYGRKGTEMHMCVSVAHPMSLPQVYDPAPTCLHLHSACGMLRDRASACKPDGEYPRGSQTQTK